MRTMVERRKNVTPKIIHRGENYMDELNFKEEIPFDHKDFIRNFHRK